jgi:hypothetical protein
MLTPRPISAPVLRPDGVEVGTGLAIAEGAAVDAAVGIEVDGDGLVLESKLGVEGRVELELVATVVVELVLVVDVEVAA